jgi:hypothetical protein
MIPHLLLVTATRGDSTWFESTIQSVDAFRSMIRLSWIIVCPASRCDDLQLRVPYARVLAEQGRGLYTAINQGVRDSESLDWSHFTYINDDDGFRPGFANSLRQIVESGGCVDVLYGDVEYVDAGGEVLGVVPVARWTDDLLPLFSQCIAPFTQQGVIVSRAMLARVNGFDESLSHVSDAHFWVKCLQANASFKYINVITSFYRIHHGQLSSNTHETARQAKVVTQLAGQHGHSRWSLWLSLFRFKLTNLPRVLVRLNRVGFMTSRQMFTNSASSK